MKTFAEGCRQSGHLTEAGKGRVSCMCQPFFIDNFNNGGYLLLRAFVQKGYFFT